MPHPVHVQVRAEDYVPVPYEPRPPPVEILPPRPEKGDVVWADGGWDWSGERYRWEPGAWVAPAKGMVRTRWVIVRRPLDGQLFFAPSTWRDASGRTVDPPAALARAVTRPGAPPATGPGGPGVPSAGVGLDE